MLVVLFFFVWLIIVSVVFIFGNFCLISVDICLEILIDLFSEVEGIEVICYMMVFFFRLGMNFLFRNGNSVRLLIKVLVVMFSISLCCFSVYVSMVV